MVNIAVYLKQLYHSFLLVGPAAMISGLRMEYITATCKQNVMEEKLPGWVLEPSLDSIGGTKCKKYELDKLC